jgi:hypothetical protein
MELIDVPDATVGHGGLHAARVDMASGREATVGQQEQGAVHGVLSIMLSFQNRK